jgi:hypothetical protein
VDALNGVLTAYISGRGYVSKIPTDERRSEDGPATGEFEIFSPAQVDQIARHFVEESQ